MRIRVVQTSEESRRWGYGLLLVSILGSYVLSLFSSNSQVVFSVIILFQLTTVWLALRVSDSHRLAPVAGVALIVLTVFLAISVILGESSGALTTINQWWFVLSTLLYLVAPIVIVRHVLHRTQVDLDSLLGVISAYLMIGMSFAFVYKLVGIVQSEPFFGTHGAGSLAQDLFFSFTSLTTVGYGDLVPAGNPGQTLAVFEAMLGQLFLVIVVAKVVTNLTGSSAKSSDDSPNNQKESE
ncbi:MAG: ion channel [Actinobacteria bacterium]|nr:ion channel [Actinomycetota bacterium]